MVNEKEKLSMVQQARDIAYMLSNDVSDDEITMYTDAKSTGSAKVHVSKPQISIRLGISNKITEELTDDEKKVLTSSSDGLVLNAFPSSDKRFSKFKSIEEGCRKKLKELSIGNSNFITEKAFREYLDFFDEKNQEWEDAKKVLNTCFDEQIEIFKANSEGIIEKLCPEHAEALKSELRRKTNISSKQFVNGFSLGLETDFDMNLIDDEVFRNAVKNAKRNMLLDGIRSAIEGMLQQAWAASCKYLETLFKLPTSSTATKVKAKNMLMTEAKNIGRDGNFTVINMISHGMSLAASENVKERAIDILYSVLSIVCGEANHNNIELPSNVLPKDPFGNYELDMIYLAQDYEDYREDVLNCAYTF